LSIGAIRARRCWPMNRWKPGCAGAAATTVRQKKLNQWFFRITDYAEDLLLYCDRLPGWPDKVITMQKNWIGRSQGAEIRFAVEDSDRVIPFSPRATIPSSGPLSCAWPRASHGAAMLAAGGPQAAVIDQFIERISLQERTSKAMENYEKEGVFTGRYCINPMTGRRMPIYTANFALMEYGTGR
jgi:leucyl-tRNA synthetase